MQDIKNAEIELTESKQGIPRVLIVDDNPQNLQVIGGALRSKNIEVEFSTSGQAAIDWLREEKFDLVLLDIMMPDMDGFEVCKLIRAEEEYENLPIIFLTAKTDAESILKGFKSGAQDYVTKPFNSSELLARVRTQLELKFSKQKLKNINLLLEEQVDIRMKQLSEANVELQQLDSAKVQFLNMLSHEIRTPLNGIKGSIQLLKLKTNNSDIKQLIDILDASVKRLEGFSYAALLITRIRSNKYSYQESEVGVNTSIENIVNKKKEELTKKGIILQKKGVDRKPVLNADKELVYEVIERILDNAINYSPEQGEIIIRIDSNDNSEIIEIKDNGPGFNEEQLGQQFKLLKPGEKHVNKNTGMSLCLIKSIMEYMDGKIEIMNNKDKGACVRLYFNKIKNIEN